LSPIEIIYGFVAFMLSGLLGLVAFFAQRMMADTERRIQSLEGTAQVIAQELAGISEKLGNLLDSLKAFETDKREIIRQMSDMKDQLTEHTVSIAELKSSRRAQ
jgi:septal ring factor EnvC (AmiA/AmiB activator)